MSNQLTIGIVEDEVIIADLLSEMLTGIGYHVLEPAARYSEAIELIENEKPDLLLLDINLLGQMDGIDLAHTVRKKFNIPFIFLTANMDSSTLERAKEVRPAAYLTKPITKDQLYTAIEIALSNFNTESMSPVETHSAPASTATSVFVKDGYAFRKILVNEILYLESEANYVAIFLDGGKKVLVRSNLEDFIQQFDKTQFIRIHRSYAVNRNKIDGVFPTEVSIGAVKVPVGKTYKEELFAWLGIDAR